MADGWCGMTTLEQQAADYLQIRRALGFKLERAEKLLAQYLAYLDTIGQDPAANRGRRELVGSAAIGRPLLCDLPARPRSRARGPAGRRARAPDPTCGPVSLYRAGDLGVDGRD
jgi:hypothetical protein